MNKETRNLWKEIWQLIERVPLKSIVCLGKGNVAIGLVEKWGEKVLVVDRDFSSFSIDSYGIAREIWGNTHAPWREHSRLITDFEKIEFRKESIGAIFIPELFLIEKKAGIEVLDKVSNWIVKNGIVVVSIPTTSDIRYKNFRSFGATFKEVLGQYEFREIIPGCLKVDPPIPCPFGCPHEYFSFYHPSEIQQRFSSFKEHINVVSEEKEGFVTFLYVAQKT
jgi:hypothetical protein